VDGAWSSFFRNVVENGGVNQVTVASSLDQQFFRLPVALGQPTLLEPPLSDPSAAERGVKLSRDGLSLYFCREIDGQADILVSARASLTSPWEEPTPIDAINTSWGNEGFPAVSADGLSLFFSDFVSGFWFATGQFWPDGFGGGDLWVSTRKSVQDPWELPVNLGPAINTQHTETEPAVSSDGLTLFFASNRPGNVPGSGVGPDGYFDLWMATRSNAADPTGWSLPINLGRAVNSTSGEHSPHLSNDGLSLYFTSSRPRPRRSFPADWDVWVARRASLSEPFGAPIGVTTHLVDYYGFNDPCLSADGSTLLVITRGLQADHPLSYGHDIWQIPILRPPPLSISLVVTSP
jgi:hypothetical protein